MVYLFLGEGFEIIEALAPVDMLRRAKIDVATVSVGEQFVTSSNGITVKADFLSSEIDMKNAQAIILPGGMPGTLNIEKSNIVQNAIEYCLSNNLYVCAICAAPSILGNKGVLNNKTVTCFPGYESSFNGANLTTSHIELDGNILTAKGAGVSVDFGLKIVEVLKGKELADEIKGKIQCR